jgi:hypothetical protein
MYQNASHGMFHYPAKLPKTYISLQVNVLCRKNNGRRVTTWRFMPRTVTFMPYWIAHMSPNIRQKVGRPLVFRSNWSVSLKPDMKVTSAATLINNVAVMRTPLTSLIIGCVQLLQRVHKACFDVSATHWKTQTAETAPVHLGRCENVNLHRVTGLTTQSAKAMAKRLNMKRGKINDDSEIKL